MSPSPGPLVAQTGRAGGSHAATTRLLQAPSSSLPVCVCVGGLPIAVGSVHVPLLVLSGTAREGARLHGQRTERGLLRETATRFPCWVSASPQGKERPRNHFSSWHPSLSAKARRPLRTRVCRAPRASARPGPPRPLWLCSPRFIWPQTSHFSSLGIVVMARTEFPPSRGRRGTLTPRSCTNKPGRSFRGPASAACVAHRLRDTACHRDESASRPSQGEPGGSADGGVFSSIGFVGDDGSAEASKM